MAQTWAVLLGGKILKDYEAIVILKANLPEERVTSLLSRFEKKIADNGGEYVSADKLGQKRLPYRLSKHKNEKDGLYILLKFKGEGKTSSVLNDDFRIQEDVIRHMIARVPVQKAVIEETPVEVSAEVKSADEAISGKSQ